MNVPSTDFDNLMQLEYKMQTNGILYLYELIHQKKFCKKYENAFVDIAIQPKMCGNPLSIQITSDDSLGYEDWCLTLMRKTAKYLRRSFKKELKQNNMIVSISEEFANICFVLME